jgi:hypothetical protein
VDNVRFQVLTVASIKFSFCDVSPCSHVEVDQRFRGAYYPHHQSDRLHGATSQKTELRSADKNICTEEGLNKEELKQWHNEMRYLYKTVVGKLSLER